MKTEAEIATALKMMKKEIIVDLREMMMIQGNYLFVNPVHIHYIAGEVATSELVKSIDFTQDEKIEVVVLNTLNEYERLNEKQLLDYDINSFIDLRTALNKELRMMKADEIEHILEENGGSMSFDGKHDLWVTIGTELERTKLLSAFFDPDTGYITFKVKRAEGEVEELDTSYLDLEELYDTAKFLTREQEKEFTITASNVLQRTFEVKAKSWEEACEIVRQRLKEAPLDEDDGLGLEFI